MFRAARVAIVLGAFVLAVAAPAVGKGKPPATGAGCRPQVMVVLHGTLAAAPGASATSVSVNATRANAHGAAYLKLGQPLAIQVDAKTKIRRQGKKTLGDLLRGDQVVVHAKACKADLNAGTPQLTAKSINAHDPSQKADEREQAGESKQAGQSKKAGESKKGDESEQDDD